MPLRQTAELRCLRTSSAVSCASLLVQSWASISCLQLLMPVEWWDFVALSQALGAELFQRQHHLPVKASLTPAYSELLSKHLWTQQEGSIQHRGSEHQL